MSLPGPNRLTNIASHSLFRDLHQSSLNLELRPPSHPPLIPYSLQGSISKAYDIINTDRAALGRVSGTIARHHGDKGFAGSIKIALTGSGGQSFGCFCIQVGGGQGRELGRVGGLAGQNRPARWTYASNRVTVAYHKPN